ncbi:MAG: hypothetical protein P8Y42_14785 [Exilibacterium sp.]
MSGNKHYLFDNPDNIKKILRALYICCAILFGLDFILHRHTEHLWEKAPVFYPLYGFVGCVVLVLVAKWMRKGLMRPEDYYDRDEISQSAPMEKKHVDT